MPIETAEEFIAQYGETEVVFRSYYKYTFFFSGTLKNGDMISCGVGGSAEDIYRDEVVEGKKCSIRDLAPYMGSVTRNGEDLFSFYDY